MLVRCGRCQIELEVAGTGEFACPSCGTRNVVRGAAPSSPFDLPDLGASGPLTTPSGPLAAPSQPTQSPVPNPDDPPVHWVQCTACAYRFAVGPVEEVSCPTCSERIVVSPPKD